MPSAMEQFISGLKDFIPHKEEILLGREKTFYSLKKILLIIEQIKVGYKQIVPTIKQCFYVGKQVFMELEQIVISSKEIVYVRQQLVKAHKEIFIAVEQFVIGMFSNIITVFQLEMKDLCFNIEDRNPASIK